MQVSHHQDLELGHTAPITALCRLSDGIFVTGAKDGKIIHWNANVEEFKVCNADDAAYSPITAVTKVAANTFAVGTSKGSISLWDFEGNKKSSCSYNEFSKPQQVHCLAPNLHGEEKTFFSGTNRYFHQISFKGDSPPTLLRYWQVKGIVSSLTKIEESKLMALFGKQVVLFGTSRKAKQSVFPLPNITCLSQLPSNNAHFSCCGENGHLMALDLTVGDIFRDYNAHTASILSTVELAPQVVVTGSSDRMIKIWDFRQAEAVTTLEPQKGAIACLESISPKQFVSCQDNGLSFWDIRH